MHGYQSQGCKTPVFFIRARGEKTDAKNSGRKGEKTGVENRKKTDASGEKTDVENSQEQVENRNGPLEGNRPIGRDRGPKAMRAPIDGGPLR